MYLVLFQSTCKECGSEEANLVNCTRPIPLATMLEMTIIPSVGGVLLIVGAVIGIRAWRRTKQVQKRHEKQREFEIRVNARRETWRIPADEISFNESNFLGRGATGIVCRGHWRDMNVAVKVSRSLIDWIKGKERKETKSKLSHYLAAGDIALGLWFCVS